MHSTATAPGPFGLGGLRLTRRGRVVVVLLALFVATLGGLVGQQAVAESPGAPLEVRMHTVAPGESLWQYAQGLASTSEDVRDVVADLLRINQLETADLEVGQVVLLPVH